MFKALYLLRHGRTVANVERRYVGQSNSPLIPSTIPTQQAIGADLRNVDFDFFYLSPIERCQLTFQIMGLTKIANLKTDDRLKEGNNGELEGYAPAELPKDFAAALAADGYNTVFPGGESYAMMDKRVMNFWMEEAPKWAGKTVGILSHWGPNSCIASQIMGWDWSRRGRWHQPNNVVYKISDGKMSFRPYGECGWYEGLSITRR